MAHSTGMQQEELSVFMSSVGYGEDEITEFLMEVDEDCSGRISWEEFVPAAGKFVAQDTPNAHISGAKVVPQSEDSAQHAPIQANRAPTRDVPPEKKAQIKEAAAQVKLEPPSRLRKDATPLMAYHAEQPGDGHTRKSYTRDDQRKEGSKSTQFWGFRVGSRLFHPVNFMEVGNKEAAATSLVRHTMQQRFQDVGEAFVFFDLDDHGALTRVRFERGLARMGLLDVINSEQLMCEVNGIYNGKLSNVMSHDFMRHFHWGHVPYDSTDGSAMVRRAMRNRDKILHRGKPPPPPPPAKVTPMPGMDVHIYQQPSAGMWPKAPDTARDFNSRRSMSTYKNLADHRKSRVDMMRQTSARLNCISTAYVEPEMIVSQGHLPQTSQALQKCQRTSFAVAIAVEQASVSEQVKILQISTPRGTPLAASAPDGLPDTLLPDYLNKDDLHDRYAVSSREKLARGKQRDEMERWQHSMRMAAEHGRLARMHLI